MPIDDLTALGGGGTPSSKKREKSDAGTAGR